jgi:hypothetical protein
MTAESKSYAVRDAGTPSRLGKINKVFPYNLRSLLEALDDARLRSFNEGPAVRAWRRGVVAVPGRGRS